MFDRWFGSWTDVVAGFAAAAVLVYLVFEVDRQQKKLKDLFFVLDKDAALMTEHLEELVRRGLIHAQRGPASA